MKKLLKIVVFLVLAAWVFGKLPLVNTKSDNPILSKVGPDSSGVSMAVDPEPAAKPAKAAKAAPVAAAASTSTCSVGQPASGEVVAVTGEFEPRTTPSNKGAKIKNEKASSILGSTQYHQIDSSTTVRQLCADGDWSEVQIVSPDWLTFVKGWVPNKVLRGIERTASGTRVYVADDIYWDDDTSKYKKQIVAIVNRIAQQHSGCRDIDTGSIARSPSRSKPKDPVFFVTCNPSAGVPFNVWFRPSDAGKSFVVVKPISQGDAVLACEKAAKAAATHPSTVDFSRFMDVAYSVRGDGRVALDSTFTAKNGFNLELKYRIRCLFDGRTYIDSSVVEAD
jgi:hypothetical protein